MTEQEKYMKFWFTLGEKVNDIQKAYNDLSDESKMKASQAAFAALSAYGMAGIIQLTKNPPRF